MTPAEGLAHLTRLSPSNIKLGLGRVRQALNQLGNPERAFQALHVAGTNGKGSTCAIAASCLGQRYHTGLYTSPHLVRPNERIQIDGEEIDDETFGRRISEVLSVLGADHELTYFEFLTVVAFFHFAQEKVQLAVLETGLGGRLDATSACVPAVTCLTPIDFDHQEYLGQTLTAIAGEKAAIARSGVPLISSRQAPEVLHVIEAATHSFRLEGRDFEVEPQPDGTLSFRGVGSRLEGLRLGLQGPHQRQNLSVALACLEAMTAFPLSSAHVRQGVESARWPGRLEAFEGSPLIVLDGAHNPAGTRALVRALKTEYPQREVHLVFGVFADKDSRPMMESLFPLATSVHLTPVGHPRSEHPRRYASLARSLTRQVEVHLDAEEALRAAMRSAPDDGLVLITGSLFLIGQLRPSVLALRH